MVKFWMLEEKAEQLEAEWERMGGVEDERSPPRTMCIRKSLFHEMTWTEEEQILKLDLVWFWIG